MSRLDQRIAAVTERIVRRSADSRKRYLDMIAREGSKGTNRSNISCGNLAHGFAASGEDKPVIKKALVELDGAPFKYFEAHREEWSVDTCFKYPGAIQYYGPTEVCDITTVTLALEQAK